MNVTAASLRTLHRIQQQLGDLRERLEGGPKQLKIREANVARLESEVAKVREEHKAARVATDQKQLLLKTGENKIRDRRAQLNVCNTNREYQTMLEQITADEMANSVLEDEILESLDKIERAQQTVSLAEANVAKGRAELAKARSAVTETENLLRGDVERLKAELAEAEKELPADFRETYDRLVRGRGEDAMARVDGDCCGGCYQSLPPNLLNFVQMQRVVVCVGCGRLLYQDESR